MTELNLFGLASHVWPALSRKPDCPGSTALNLDATRTYWLLRDPSELRKAMKTFKQILSRIDHRPCRVSIIPIALVITSTASDTELNNTDLTNSLVICAEPAIRAVESGERWDISCGP